MCMSGQYPYFPLPTKGTGISLGMGEGAICKTPKFKEMCEALLEFPEGWGGGLKKSLPWGRYGYFLELHNIIS